MTDPARKHFNSIADKYRDEIPSHVRDHLINKLWSFSSPYFFSGCKALDIGCGDGSNAAFFFSKEVDITGVDFSEKLIHQGNKLYPYLRDRLGVGDGLDLQFQDCTFDIALLIGVLHHIQSREHQTEVVREALRTVKNGGFVLIRESNLINPVFRFFWHYIFPLISKIDKFGGENWVTAKYLHQQFKDFHVKTIYFTFIPSNIPNSLLPFAGKAEKALEKSKIKKLSAHYLIVLKKHG